MRRASTTRPGLLLAVVLLLALCPGPAGAASSVVLEPVVTGLTSPLGIVHAGDDRLFVVQRTGQIVIVEGTQVLAPAFLDIAGVITCCAGERGLLGLAFHPEYATNRFFFVSYTEPDGSIVIARYQRSATNVNLANPASGQVLLRIPHGDFANHNGGQIAFGPDGYLYASIGDGGGANDTLNSGQNLGTLLGKLLRIDVDSAVPYAIPADNPFAGEAGAGGRSGRRACGTPGASASTG